MAPYLSLTHDFYVMLISLVESPAELVTIITALAVVLAILILLLCFLAFYGAGWRYNR